MEIGRRIYYDLATGNGIKDTGERSGSVVETTIEQDKQSYSELIELVSSTVGMIQLVYGERANEFSNMGSLHVDPQTKVLTIYPRLTIATDKAQIASDGVDTATITSDHAGTFSVGGGQEYAVNPFLFASTVTGTYTITAKSTLHGQNSLTVEVV